MSAVEQAFAAGQGKRALLLLTGFPFLLIGTVEGVAPGLTVVRAEDAVPSELRGRPFHVVTDVIAAFYVERAPGEIPRLDGSTHRKRYVALGDIPSADTGELLRGPRGSVAVALHGLLGRDVLLVLRPDRLHLLGSVFRPLLVGRVGAVQPGLVWLDAPNLRLPTAPDFVFPLPLAVPLGQIGSFAPLSRDVQFPLV